MYTCTGNLAIVSLKVNCKYIYMRPFPSISSLYNGPPLSHPISAPYHSLRRLCVKDPSSSGPSHPPASAAGLFAQLQVFFTLLFYQDYYSEMKSDVNSNFTEIMGRLETGRVNPSTAPHPSVLQ